MTGILFILRTVMGLVASYEVMRIMYEVSPGAVTTSFLGFFGFFLVGFAVLGFTINLLELVTELVVRYVLGRTGTGR